jgi:hypothetical protein
MNPLEPPDVAPTVAEHRDPVLRSAILVAAFCSIAAAIYTLTRAQPAPAVATFLEFGPLIAAFIWVQRDARRRHIGPVQDFGMFIWLAWPLAIPWYAFRSRGRAGWRLLVALLALISSAYLTAYTVTWLSYGIRLTLWYLNVN